MTRREREAMRENIITAILFFSIVANIIFVAIIYAQAKNNKQLIWDLNVSQTAFKIQQNEIAQGLCLKNLGELK